MVGDREKYLAGLRRELEIAQEQLELSQAHQFPVEHTVDHIDHVDHTESQAYQTFPTRVTQAVVKQDNDLTCGMRCLQNMYGRHIVTRDEMDTQAKFLETKSFGEPMYNPQMGDYSIEVLQAVLESKGKWIQRIDIDKIPSDYYISIIEKNTTFVGYIVAFDGHYVTIQYKNGIYRCLDSIRGVDTRLIDKRMLFKPREKQIYCSQDTDDERPVIAVLAIGGSPFVEYLLLHNSWPSSPPSPLKYSNVISYVLRPSLNKVAKKAISAGSEVVQWYNRWKKIRTQPTDTTMRFLTTFVRERLSNEKTIIVKKDSEQAAIRCSSVEGLLHELMSMQWIVPETPFFFSNDNEEQVIQDNYGNSIDFETEALLEEFGLCENTPITLCSYTTPQAINQANVGGFYTFKCKIEGTCIGQQHNAYSVRDTEGKVHVIYKHCIEETIKK